METVKSVLGFGKTEQQGQEPISGQQGSGTVAEPYDAGNQVEDPSLGGKAPQETNPLTETAQPDTTTTSSATAPTTSEPTMSSTTAADTTAASGKPDISDPTPTTTTSSGGVSVPSQETNEPTKTGGIGSSSWFSTAIPFGRSKPAETTQTEPEPTVSGPAEPVAPTTTTSTQDPTPQAAPEKKLEDLPPNHLPSTVPPGQSTDFAAPVAPTSTNDYAPNTTDTTSSSAGPTDIAGVSGSDAMAAPSSVEQPTTTTGPRSSELPGTRASVSQAPADLSNAPLRPAHRGEPHGDNHGSIPTAGGQVIGQEAMEERKASIDARRASAAVPAAVPETVTEKPEVTTGPETVTAPSMSTGTESPADGITGSAAAPEKMVDDSHATETEGKEKKSHNPLHKLKEKLHHHKH